MMSLFSSFDYKLFSPFIMILLLMILNLNSNVYKINFSKNSLNTTFQLLDNFFLSLKPKKFNKFMNILLMSIIISLIYLNTPSVTSFNFATTSQVSVVMYVSLSMWMCYMIFMATKMVKGLIMHCIPEGTPIYLTWFLFIIEIISNMIRPLTITVRLAANILAGHLLMILLSKLALMYPYVSLLYMGLNLIEFFVALIQAYIFTTMLTLYYSEME